MAISQTTILSTRDDALEPRRLGQVIAVPSGRLDKVSVYLEPVFSSATPVGTITMEVYSVTVGGIPTGSPLAEDSKDFSELFGNCFFNFRVECSCPSRVAIVLKTSGSSSDSVGWRYGLSGSAFYPYLVSTDSGSSWTSISTRKFAYLAYSHILEATDAYDQSSSVLPGSTSIVLDDTQAEWQQGLLTNLEALSDNTVILTIGDQAITFVLDQSGSMGWNDPNGSRFDFVKDVIDDIEATLPSGDEARYSILAFSSMPIDDVILYSSSTNPLPYKVRIVRKPGSAPLSPTDGIVLYEGYARSYEDSSVSSGTSYYYSAYTIDEASLFSEAKRDYCNVSSSSKQPYGVADFVAEEEITADPDLGKRKVNLSWSNPYGYDYSSVVIVRRTDRFAESPLDGTIVASPTAATTAYVDDMSGSEEFVNGLTYYYSIFTVALTTVKSSSLGARNASVLISMADRSWEMDDPPTPPPGFDVTPPAAPVVTSSIGGDEAVKLTWTGDADSKRFKVYYREDRYPVILAGGSYDGTLLQDGESLSAFHYQLENLQPYFYVIVAYDLVGNQSNPTQVSVTPTSSPSTGVEPPPPESLRVDLVSQSKVIVTFSNPSPRISSASGYYGLAPSFKAMVIPRQSSFVPENTFLDVVQVEKSSDVIRLDHNIVLDSLDATAGVSATESIDAQEATPTSTVSMKPSFYTEDGTGNKIIEITAAPVQVDMRLPFQLSVSNEPPQTITRRTWRGVVTADDGSKTKVGYEEASLPGVLTGSGIPVNFVVEATFAGISMINESLSVLVSVIDKTTGEQSQVVELIGASDDGTLSLELQETEYEILDRTGQPTGRYEQRLIGRVQIPPQDVPGDYTLRVQGTYSGYDITSESDFYSEPSLNIDLSLSGFMPDGSEASEQSAFVYTGDFNGDSKVAIPDGLAVDWTLTCVAGCPLDGQARPFYGPGGTSPVRSLTTGGVAKQVYFGPGLDVVPATGQDAAVTDGELYEVKAVSQYRGMTRVAYGFVELLPISQAFDTYNRIFLRKQGGFNSDVIFADGVQESTWEVIADASGDLGGFSSGKYFYDRVIALGGSVPVLADGSIVTLIVEPLYGESPGAVLIKTDLSTDGRIGSARATVSSGKAVFSLSLNQRILGAAERGPTSVPRNIVYGAGQILRPSVPLLYSIRALVTVETSGIPIVYSGGGADVKYSIPPCFIGFKEPLSG